MSKHNKKILIIGDSWSRSWYHGFVSNSFQNLAYIRGRSQQSHPFPLMKATLEQVIETVIDETIPGNDLARITHDLKLSEEQNIDYIIFIQTDPMRNFDTNKFKYLNLDKFIAMYNRTLKETYTELHDISKNRFNSIPILMLGGHEKINTSILNEINSDVLHCVEPSMLEYLYKISMKTDITLEEFMHYPLLFPRWSHDIDSTWNKEIINFIHDQKLYYDRFIASDAFYQWMRPDVHHLNASGLIRISDRLLEYIETNFDK